MKSLKGKNKNKGFTSIELVMVLVILGILSAIVVPKFVSLQSDALSAAKKANSGSVKSSLAIYVAENKAYPTVAALASDISGGTAATDGISVSIDGSPYTVQTYTDTACSTATTATTDTINCIGDIP